MSRVPGTVRDFNDARATLVNWQRSTTLACSARGVIRRLLCQSCPRLLHRLRFGEHGPVPAVGPDVDSEPSPSHRGR
jgi:hypothetical protein